MNTSRVAGSNAWLDRMQYRADPLADATIARILGPWTAADSLPENDSHWRRLALVNRVIESWQDNRVLLDWKRDDPDTPAELAARAAST